MAWRIRTKSASTAFIYVVLSFGSPVWAIDGAARTSAEDKQLYISGHSGAVDLKIAGTAMNEAIGRRCLSDVADIVSEYFAHHRAVKPRDIPHE